MMAQGTRTRTCGGRLPLSVLLLIAMAVGCGSAEKRHSTSPPEWMYKLPKDKNVFYAIGSSGPGSGMYESEVHVATENARAEIGRIIESRVSSVFMMHTQGNREYVQEVVSNVSETTVRGAQMVESWRDVDGVFGHRNYTYVLVRFGRSELAESIVKTAKTKAASQNVGMSREQIEQAADKAFAELESELEKKNQR